jgi:outer membrane lipoprotein carrier protein
MLHDLITYLALALGKPAPALPPTAPAPIATPLAVAGARVFLAPDASMTAPASAEEIIGKVQAFYANVQQVSAKFRQQVTNSTFGESRPSDGRVWIQKPGKMRWDYYAKAKTKVYTKKSFISNGTYLYVVEHDNQQIMKKSLEKDLMPVAVSFLYGKGDLKSDFTGEIDVSGKYGSKGDITLKLTPKMPSAQYKNLFLVVDPLNFRVKQSIIIDSASNVNHFRFYEPNFDTAIGGGLFEFKPTSKDVKNYRMVEVDDPAKPAATPDAPTTKL